jgi:hypothetical protein
VNILVALLRRRQALVDDAVTRPTITGHALERLLQQALPDEWAEGLADQGVRRQIEAAYIPRIDAETWESARAAAGRREPVAAPEWVSMVPSASAPAGVTLPQDDDPEPRVSMFIRDEGRTRSVSLELQRQLTRSTVAVSIGGGHCGKPDDGKCDPGSCGRCRKRVREDGGEWGLVCWCGHSQTS